MTRGAGWFSPPKALARKRSAAAASRLADRRKSIVAPLESTARYDKEKRRYQPTARRMTSGSNCLHLNRPETDDARSIGAAYQTTPAKLQHCRLKCPSMRSCNRLELTA